jgi:DNA-binding transcriptional LysR family regulator
MKQEEGAHPWTLEGPEGQFEVKASGTFSSNDLSVLIQAAAQGMGIALLPLLETHHYVDSGQLIRLLPQYQSVEYGIYALYPSARHLSPRVRLFVDFLSEWMKAHYQACTTACHS